MIAKFPPPPNTSNLTDQVWRDWFYKLSVAMNRVWEVTSSPSILSLANGTYPMSGMNGEIQDGDVDGNEQISFITMRGGSGGSGGGGSSVSTQLVPIFFFCTDDNDDGYVGPPWTM